VASTATPPQDVSAPRAGARSYDAFLSYSHAADGHLAPALQAGLQSLAKPWYRRRALRVFRDKTSLSASPELWPAIQGALSQARYFVLLASPEAAASHWVEQEVRWWRAHRSHDTVLIALTDGELRWDDSRRDFDPASAIPPGLGGWFPLEPLWVDLRWARAELDVSMRNPRFRDSVGEVAAPLRGVPKDDLIGEDIRQHRRTVRLVRLAATVLVLLTAAAVSGGLIALQQRNTAREQRNIAREQRQIAISRQLAAESAALRPSDPATSLLLAVEARRAAATQEARESLLATLTETHFAKRYAGAHRKGVTSVAVSRDGELLATASDDETVVIWDASTATPLSRLRGFRGLVSRVRFSPRRDVLATSVFTGATSLWDIRDPRRPERRWDLVKDAGTSPALSFSADGRMLVTSAAGGYEIWDLRADAPTLAGFVPDHGREVALSGDAQTLAIAKAPGRTTLWDTADAARPVRLTSLPVVADSVSYSPDAQSMATVPRDRFAVLWNVTDPRRPRRRATLSTADNSPAWTLAFSSRPSVAATANYNDTISLWSIADTARPRQLAVLGGHRDSLTDLAFTPAGDRLVSSSNDRTAIAWLVGDRSRPAPVATLRGYRGAPETIAFDPSRSALLAGSDLDGLALWNVRIPSRPRQYSRLGASSRGVSAAVFSDDGRTLMTTALNDEVVLWDVANLRHPARLIRLKAAGGALSPDGRTLATTSTSDDRVVVWSLAERARPMQVASVPGASAALGSHGRLLAFRPDRRATLWTIAKPSRPVRVATLPPARTATFSRDGRTLSTSGASTTRLWDVREGEDPRRLGSVPSGTGDEASFSADGRILAVGDADGAPTLWDISDRQHPLRVAALVGHRGSAYRVTFSGDGRTAATGSFDMTVKLWDISALAETLADPIGQACAIAGPALTRDAWRRYLPGTPYRRTCD
jgi:WD40 repeat protein